MVTSHRNNFFLSALKCGALGSGQWEELGIGANSKQSQVAKTLVDNSTVTGPP